MPDRGPSKNAYNNGLSYVASKPKFLQNFGAAPLSPPRRGESLSSDGGRGSGRNGRDALPERPREGKWASGSGDEAENGGSDDDDEWGEVFGGDADGPQIVVLKEGRHLSKDEVQRERRRAAGKPSQSPPPSSDVPAKPADEPARNTLPNGSASLATTAKQPKAPLQSASNRSAKRKLVGEAADAQAEKQAKTGGGSAASKKKTKKAKPAGAMLSFDEGEGET